jgi:hypothetical protein
MHDQGVVLEVISDLSCCRGVWSGGCVGVCPNTLRKNTRQSSTIERRNILLKKSADH